jgi:hypothetical protein
MESSGSRHRLSGASPVAGTSDFQHRRSLKDRLAALVTDACDGFHGRASGLISIRLSSGLQLPTLPVQTPHQLS